MLLRVPLVGSLAAEVFDLRVRGPGFGVYFLWYFGGMPVLIFSAGLLRDWTGSLTATLLYADIMLLCTLLLAIYLRITQGHRAVRT